MDNNTLNLLNLINIAAAICSAVAFIYAIYQGRNAKKQAELLKNIGQQAIDHAKHLQQQTDKMEHINKSMSTRYIGDFSTYLKDVVELISKAEKEVLIVCTLPCHGIYSYPKYAEPLRLAVDKIRTIGFGKISIKCVFANDKHRRIFIKNQFHSTYKNWESYKSNPENINKIEYFFKRYESNEIIDIQSMTEDKFFDLFEKASIQLLNNTYKGTYIEINHRPPIYIWVVDNEAIFAFISTVPAYGVQAFYTRDQGLISALKNIHKEYEEQRIDSLAS